MIPSTVQTFHTKRCVDVSPSVAKPSAKARAAGNSRRRSIDFGVGETQSANPPLLQVSIWVCYADIF